MTGLAAVWGVRLTYNFARKGGYRPGGEDYRWPELRRRLPGWAFALLNVVFICVTQHALLLLLALPAWYVARRPTTPLGPIDAAAAATFVLFLAGETIADQQQWRFQQTKARRLAGGDGTAPRFLTTGLFRWSRHPNFFCEQGLWWAFALFAVGAGERWIGPAWSGAAALTLLFLGSTAFTESISLARYPEYAAYQRTTSRLIPLPPRRAPS